MNIKILEPIDESLVLQTIPFGSKVYGTDTVDSDEDYVKILDENKIDSGNLVLQYKGDKVDYIYTTEHNFYELARNGGNVVFFEARLLEAIERTQYFQVDKYKVAKAYLGLAKRDLHYPERLWHVNRCLWMTNKVMHGHYIDLTQVKHIKANPVTFDEIKALRDQLNKLYGKT